jgi:hypothetical protein
LKKIKKNKKKEDKKQFPTMYQFVAEQNRLERTGGLPADHPNGAVAPCDVPFTPRERDFFRRQLEEALKGLE